MNSKHTVAFSFVIESCRAIFLTFSQFLIISSWSSFRYRKFIITCCREIKLTIFTPILVLSFSYYLLKDDFVISLKTSV